MAVSMTGYGREKREIGGYEITVEIKTVNNRYFDSNIRVPKSFGFLEEKIRAYLMKRINRGKTDVFVYITNTADGDFSLKVNKTAAQKYYNAYKELSELLNVPFDLTADKLGRMQEVLSQKEEDADETKVWGCVFSVLTAAADDIIAMRKTEGNRLEADVLSGIEILRSTVSQIEKRLPESVKDYEKRLREKMDEYIGSASYDEARLLTEVAIFSDKVATFEETIRLKSHFDSFSELVKKDMPVGKKLDFIVQEMNREVNTICSKCQDIEISKLGIDAKSQIEAIREQIQNIE